MISKALLITCEHGGNKIPKKYQNLFAGHERTLSTHRGLDIGALGVAKRLSQLMSSTLVASEISRLLVDLNRSRQHKNLFSEMTHILSDEQKNLVLKKYYFPHHIKVQNYINSSLKDGCPVIHIGIHSFTPVFNTQKRNADIGILYDPKSKFESSFANCLKTEIKNSFSALRVRLNYPYRGTSDGLTKSLRGAFGSKNYAGIEIEINQKFFEKHVKLNQTHLAQLLARTILHAKDSI